MFASNSSDYFPRNQFPHIVWIPKPLATGDYYDTWCINTFGPQHYRWHSWGYRWRFANIDDAVMFCLTHDGVMQ